MRSKPVKDPTLFRDLILEIDDLNRSFVPLRSRIGASLHLFDDLPRILKRFGHKSPRLRRDPAVCLLSRGFALPLLYQERAGWIHVTPVRQLLICSYSYSRDSTRLPRTADSAGPTAAMKAAARMMGIMTVMKPTG